MAYPSPSLLTVSGDAFRRGYLHGSQARELIHQGVQFYLGLGEKNVGRSKADLLQLAGGFAPAIEDYDPEIWKELEGIASGANLSINEILLLNARYELMLVALFTDGEARLPAGECTSLAALPGATPNGHTLVAQNWDLSVEAGSRSVLLEIQQEDRPSIVTHVEAGLVGHKGMNSAGLGLCVNALSSQHDRFAPQVPVWVMARSVLNSSSLQEAHQAVLRAERAASVNFLVGSDAGEIASLELTPRDVGWVPPIDDRLAHGNVFCDLSEERGITDRLGLLYPQFSQRARRARELIADTEPSVPAFMRILQDHANRPESICRHHEDQPPEAPEAIVMETLASIIMDLTERSLYLTAGPPCRNDYTKFTVASLQNACTHQEESHV